MPAKCRGVETALTDWSEYDSCLHDKDLLGGGFEREEEPGIELGVEG